VKFAVSTSKTTMFKVTQSSKNITPFGGLNFIYDAITRKGLKTFIDKQLGARHALAHYSYSDILLSLFGNSLCQGEYISDLQILKSKFSEQVFGKIPSPDTVEYVCQELKTTTIEIASEHDSKIIHQINYNHSLNKNLISLAIETQQLNKENKAYVLDFDNVVVATEKQDAKMSYKGIKGYHPNISFVGRIPVHIENHNGNTPARYAQAETLKRCFENLEEQHISIAHFRADSASYQKEVINVVSKKATHFYVRIIDFADIREYCAGIQNWETIEINHQQKEVGTTFYCPFGQTNSYRIVVTRTLKKTAQIDFESNSAYNYYGIMTNNTALSNKEIIEFYNQRGDAENANRFLLNDFNLHHLPFPDMCTNTVYMYLMAMCATLFEWTKIILVNNKTEKITLNMRVKTVCFHYITVATQFVEHARQKIIQVFSPTEYCILEI
jgi:Transposase DDE domain group 1